MIPGRVPTERSGRACVTLFRKVLTADTSPFFIHAVKLVFTRKSDYSLYLKNRRIHQGFCSVPAALPALFRPLPENPCNGSEIDFVLLRPFSGTMFFDVEKRKVAYVPGASSEKIISELPDELVWRSWRRLSWWPRLWHKR